MKTSGKMDRSQMASQNKRVVYECIRRNRVINRSTIAKEIGLSLPSVMTITEGLIENGFIHSPGKEKSHGGKRAELLEICSDYGYIVGLDAGRSMLRAAVCDMNSNMLCSLQDITGNDLHPLVIIERMCRLVEKVITYSKVPPEKIIGIGVAMPGLIERKTGTVLFSPDYNWQDISLRDILFNRLHYPIIIENSNMSRAIDDVIRRGILDEKLLYVNLGFGIGGAVIINGEPYYGSSGTSGEIGHMIVEKDGDICFCGNHGCLEAMASGAAIVRHANVAVLSGKNSSLTSITDRELEAKDVFDAAKAGDSVSAAIIEKAINYTAIGIAGVINLLDPSRVVLFGGLTENGPYYTTPLIQAINTHKMNHASKNCSIEIMKKSYGNAALASANMIFMNREYIPAFSYFSWEH